MLGIEIVWEAYDLSADPDYSDLPGVAAGEALDGRFGFEDAAQPIGGFVDATRIPGYEFSPEDPSSLPRHNPDESYEIEHVGGKTVITRQIAGATSYTYVVGDSIFSIYTGSRDAAEDFLAQLP